jgi:hypothetical protein
VRMRGLLYQYPINSPKAALMSVAETLRQRRKMAGKPANVYREGLLPLFYILQANDRQNDKGRASHMYEQGLTIWIIASVCLIRQDVVKTIYQLPSIQYW